MFHARWEEKHLFNICIKKKILCLLLTLEQGGSTVATSCLKREK
jgi:hypothetical protein